MTRFYELRAGVVEVLRGKGAPWSPCPSQALTAAVWLVCVCFGGTCTDCWQEWMIPIQDSYPAKFDSDSDSDVEDEPASGGGVERPSQPDDISGEGDDASPGPPSGKVMCGGIQWRVPLWLRNGSDYYIEIGSSSEVYASGTFTIRQQPSEREGEVDAAAGKCQ